jgi:hypothetical protein
LPPRKLRHQLLHRELSRHPRQLVEAEAGADEVAVVEQPIHNTPKPILPLSLVARRFSE